VSGPTSSSSGARCSLICVREATEESADHDNAVPTRDYQSDQSSRMLLAVVGPAVQNKTHSRLTSGNVFPLCRPPTGAGAPERCSKPGVRFAAPKGSAPWTAPSRSGPTVIAAGSSGGNTRRPCCADAKAARGRLPSCRRKPARRKPRHARSGLTGRSISEHELDRQLHQARGARLQDLAECRRLEVVLGQPKIRMVQQVEALRAKLHAPGLVDIEVLEQ